jgi:molecular chaperone Hsp33
MREGVPTRNAMNDESDSVLRAMTDDGTFRVITVRTTRTVRDTVAAQGVTGATASLLADLVTGAVLVRESMAPDLRVQVIVQSGEQRTRVIADAHPGGTSRGLVQRPSPSHDVTLRDGDLLQVARTLHNGALQQGTVAVSADGGVSQALMQYMQLSEQVVTMCAVGSQRDRGELVAAGGYLVQLLPEVLDPSGPLLVMAERLKGFQSMEALFALGLASPAKLAAELLYGMPYSVVGEASLRFGCYCSAERVALALSTLPKSEIEELLRQDTATELTCDYCGKVYSFQKSHLRGLLARN